MDAELRRRKKTDPRNLGVFARLMRVTFGDPHGLAFSRPTQPQRRGRAPVARQARRTQPSEKIQKTRTRTTTARVSPDWSVAPVQALRGSARTSASVRWAPVWPRPFAGLRRWSNALPAQAA